MEKHILYSVGRRITPVDRNAGIIGNAVWRNRTVLIDMTRLSVKDDLSSLVRDVSCVSIQ